MWSIPRIAVGSVQRDAECETILWGLLAMLQRQVGSVQAFRSRACFAVRDGARIITGRTSRHLDSWLMDEAACHVALARGSREAGLALVAGRFDTARPAWAAATATGGSLDTLCDWLDLGRIAVLDVARWGRCELPLRPARLDGIFLDRVSSFEQLNRCRTEIESLWGVPVIAHLDEAASLRSRALSVPAGSEPPLDLCAALGARLERSLQFERLQQIAERGELRSQAAPDFRIGSARRPLRIAVAYDGNFSCYFPDTLDWLEASGAVIRDFSPLRSESLPDDTDIVYFGCGHPERHLEALAANHCLQQSLRSYAAAGGRIYGEGAGLAYLCRQIVLPDGRSSPMTGLLPATARLVPGNGEFEPVEITFGADCWLANARSRLRGYRHSGWQIEPTGPLKAYAACPPQRLDMLGCNNVIGSRLLVNFAAQAHLLRRFFVPLQTPSRIGI